MSARLGVPRRHVRPLLFALAAGDPDAVLRVAGLDAGSAVRLARRAHAEKVAASALHHLQRLPADSPFGRALRETLAEDAGRHVVYERELAALAEADVVERGAVMLLKGWAIGRWYGGTPRQSRDMDLVVARERDLWALYRWLQRRGWVTMPIAHVRRRRDAPGDWAFYFGLVRAGDVTDRGPQIDLICGSTLLGWRSAFDLGPIVARARSTSHRSAPGGILLPVLRDTVLALLVEVSDRSLVVRDALDLSMLLASMGDEPGLDLAALVEHVAAHKLAGQFRRLIEFHRRIAPNRLPPDVIRFIDEAPPERVAARVLRRGVVIGSAAGQVAEAEGVLPALRETSTALRELVVSHPGMGWLAPRLALGLAAVGRRRTWFHLLHLFDREGAPAGWVAGPRGAAILVAPWSVFVAGRARLVRPRLLDRTRSEVASIVG